MKTKLKSARFLANGKPIAFEQKGYRIVLKNMPRTSPDKLVGVTVIELTFKGEPQYKWHATTPVFHLA